MMMNKTATAAFEREMRIHFTLRHTHKPNGIQPYATDAVQLFKKHFDGITDCHIILDHQPNDKPHNKIAEITVHVHDHTFVSKESAETYEKAIDTSVNCICKQLQKHKEKVRHL